MNDGYKGLVRPTIVFPVISSSWNQPPIKNALVPPIGNKDRKYNSCGTTLFAELLRPLCPVPTHRLPVNAGNASKDTWVSPFPSPWAAHLPVRFSLRSQLCGTLCGCAADFTPAFCGFNMLCLLNTKCVRLSRTFFRTARTISDSLKTAQKSTKSRSVFVASFKPFSAILTFPKEYDRFIE